MLKFVDTSTTRTPRTKAYPSNLTWEQWELIARVDPKEAAAGEMNSQFAVYPPEMLAAAYAYINALNLLFSYLRAQKLTQIR